MSIFLFKRLLEIVKIFKCHKLRLGQPLKKVTGPKLWVHDHKKDGTQQWKRKRLLETVMIKCHNLRLGRPLKKVTGPKLLVHDHEKDGT